MTPIQDFIEAHKAELLRRAGALARGKTPDPASVDFVRRVLDEFEPLKGHFAAEPVTLVERAFWFALYQLESLVEHPTPGFSDPYEQMMLDDLHELRIVVARGGELPMRFFATRPGEPLVEEDDLDPDEVLDGDPWNVTWRRL